MNQAFGLCAKRFRCNSQFPTISVGEKSARDSSFNGEPATMTSARNSSESNLLYVDQRNTRFWNKKRFLFSVKCCAAIIIVLGVFFTVDNIYNQGKASCAVYNLYNTSLCKILGKPIERDGDETAAAMRQRRDDETDTAETDGRGGGGGGGRVSAGVTCELNDGIRGLNAEVKRLYENLLRLNNNRVDNRRKRGSYERTATAVDCARMNENFKKILAELNGISDTLSSVDENGMCRRCNCTSDGIIARRATERPSLFDALTTFDAYDDAVDEPTVVARRPPASEKTKQLKRVLVSRYDPGRDAAATMTNDGPPDDGNEFDAAPELITDNAATAVTNEDTMSPAMSDAVTSYFDFENDTRTATDERWTVRVSRDGFADYSDDNSATTVAETVFDYDGGMSAAETGGINPYVSEPTVEIPDALQYARSGDGNNGTIIGRTTTTTTTTTMSDDGVSSGTTSAVDAEENNRYYGENVSSRYENGDENYNTTMTTTSVVDDGNDYVTSTPASPSRQTSGNESVIESTTRLADENADERVGDNNNNKSSPGIRDKNVTGDRPATGRNSTDEHGSQRPEDIQRMKWYPICFNPVPCPPENEALGYPRDDKRDDKSAIQYSAQSLGAYKKKSPVVVDAAILGGNNNNYYNYPIMTYCPVGAVCPTTTGVPGQSNTLHCMWKKSSVAANTGSDGNVSLKNNHYDRTAIATTAKGRNAREENGEILTGDLDCPPNTFPCVDNSGCVDTENWCDGRVHCNDATDESQCVCKERIDKDKLCDGYYDCPNGEDELGCFGCNNETFSCGDWDIVSQRSSCFERKARCDNNKNCPNGRDEDECTLLSKNLGNSNQMFFVSFTTGYLHRNWKGKWYPMCSNHPIETWAEKACTVESGQKSKPNRIQYVNGVITYDGPYISVNMTGQIVTLHDMCKHRGILVECEAEICGTRSELKFNKIVDADRMRRSFPYAEYSTNVTSRYSRSKDPRVVGGVASNPGAWPWLIALYQDGIFHCGGVILSDQWVLTAAHCVNQYQKHFYEVQAGILRRFSFSPMEQSRIVTHVMIHTQYSRTTMENDLAVLRLERGLDFNRWIRPVCLPDNKLNWIPFPGTICTAVGWGATVEHGPDPDNMREVEVPILPECTHQTDIDGKEICAGYLSGGHDTCQGDSGGPLLCREPNNLNKWYVAGIVSHGEGCARPMEPGVYTRVSLYMDWIVKVTDDNSLPQDRPQEYCPGIRCETGNKCIPKKRQCDKYVDCMNAEDEQNCDYTGSQYQINFYRSRNTDRSNLKHKLKSSGGQHYREPFAVTTVPSAPRPAAVYGGSVAENATELPKSADETSTAYAGRTDAKNDGGNRVTGLLLNETVMNAIRQLFDNQLTEETFSCRRITQVVLRNHRCDGAVDCEDGTDEEACDCRTRLTNVYGTGAVCDGMVDCHDGSDETECDGEPKCKHDETVCGKPRKCVKKTAWCDGVIDCGGGDGRDEKYCTALTDGTTNVMSDNTGRPAFQRSGVVTVNKRGVWRVRCVNESTANRIAYETCSSLRFSDSKYYEKRISWNSNLPLNVNRLKVTDVCEGLYVECGARKAVDAKPYHWHADIVVDGRLEQTGVLITDSWVLVKRTGLNVQKSYATAVLGGSAYSSMWIKSPYEQIVRVDGIEEIPGAVTDLDLIHLSVPAGISRGVTPLGVPLFQPVPGPNDTCYAIGYYYSDDHRRGNKTDFAVLRPDAERCDDGDGGNVCFTVSRKPQSCTKGKNMSRVTAIVCQSNFDLFVAATFATALGDYVNFCDNHARVKLPATTENLINEIASITEKTVKSSPAPVCDGKRCQLGKCVPWEKVCDGIPDCRDEQDETIKMCQMRSAKCKTNHTLCICDVGSFRCSNGKCVEKSAFCDGINNCGDWTDEPKSCQTNTCVEYLKLTAPERLCDGRWDCLDKTDEEFTNCPGYCNRTNVYQCQSSNKCISSELVCDGEADCLESDDESECIGLITPARNKHLKNEGVLAIRSYGNWHAQCITEDYTNVDYHSLCKGLGFKHAVGIRKVESAKVDFENFTIVQLNNITDVTIRSATKRILQQTDHTCTTMYVVCSSS